VDDKPKSPVQPAPEPPDLSKLVQGWLLKRFGALGVVVLALFSIWWQWDHIKKLPLVETLVAYLTVKSLPKALHDRFNVAIVHLEGDTDHHEMERLVRESLNEFQGVATPSLDRTIVSEHGNSEQDEREGHARARSLLKASGADALIWGVVLKKDGKSLPKLYWTVLPESEKTPSAGRYPTNDDLSLPALFWRDLADVLGLLVATRGADFIAHHGQYQADKLRPFIQRVRALLNASRAQWDASTRAKVQLVLSLVLSMYGQQSGSDEALHEAVTGYREALTEVTRRKVPLEWAGTQHNLGVALWTLGRRESDPARLTEAVVAFHEALKERTREKAPLQWAMTQIALGNAVMGLGERESDPARLTEAVVAFQEALKEVTREKAPFYWAMTQHNLGGVLTRLGERESDSARLTEAVAAFHEALKELTREKMPLHWAGTEADLGTALQTLGGRESDPARLTEAVTAYREALKERTRAKVPLEWAGTQTSLGNALMALAMRESDPARLTEAVAAHREALKERTREKVDRYPFCGRHELAFKSYPRPVGGSPVTTTTSAGGG
jgi:tetratricopeptide (TPR) repeat protein